MKAFHAAALCVAIIAAPASAGSVADTHMMRWAPSGKVPAVTFHPLKRSCTQAAQPIHIAGKMQLTPAAGERQFCAAATNDSARNKVVPSEKSDRSSVDG